MQLSYKSSCTLEDKVVRVHAQAFNAKGKVPVKSHHDLALKLKEEYSI